MTAAQLRRDVGLWGAVAMGLGSIVGTGVFVSLGLAAELAGTGLLLALLLAAVLAGLNGMSSAQLAAAYPVSGGTYEYANRTLGPRAGFTAGWMFLSAKSASAATAALGFSGYALQLLGGTPSLRVPTALALVALTTGVVWLGARRTNLVNTVAISITLAVLTGLVLCALPTVAADPSSLTAGLATTSMPGLLEATALLFVAYTGYGRIATLGEEVIDPRRTIPRAILATLLVVLVLYLAVAAAALGVLGASDYGQLTRQTAAPLEAVAHRLQLPWLVWTVGLGAATAMLGVQLNLVLGLSRVLLAMARRGDAPALLARIDATGTTPGPAVLTMGGIIGALVLLGDVRTTWSFSAFTVLVYYALTNLSALRLPPEHQLYPRWLSWGGLAGCAFLALWVPPIYWVAGLGLLGVGHALREVLRRVGGA